MRRFKEFYFVYFLKIVLYIFVLLKLLLSFLSFCVLIKLIFKYRFFVIYDFYRVDYVDKFIGRK